MRERTRPTPQPAWIKTAEVKQYNKACEGCEYYAIYTDSCDYILFTGHSRVKMGVAKVKPCPLRVEITEIKRNFFGEGRK